MQIIENLLQTGIRAFRDAQRSREVATVIAKANRANVPVVVVDTRVDPKAAADNNLKLASFIGSDNYEGGRLAGEHLAKVTGGKARVAVLEGIPGHETGDSRLRGFRDALATHPGMTIVASQPANWERDQGFTGSRTCFRPIRNRRAVRLQRPDGARRARGIAAAGRSSRIRVWGSTPWTMRGRRSRRGGWKPRWRNRRATWGACGRERREAAARRNHSGGSESADRAGDEMNARV